MRSWEELTVLEQMACEYSDFHKEAYGFRPRHSLKGWTVEDFEREFATFRSVCEANAIAEREAEKIAIAEFESRVLQTVALGAGDSATAIRWIAEAEDCGGDMQYLCFLLGLPYGYFGGNKY
jgi:hypothetical protein